MVVAESMAVGLPVIAASSGGISKMFEDGRSGYLVNGNGFDNVVDKLELLLTDKAKQAEMSKHAKSISACYRADAVAAETYEYYRQILAEEHPSG